MTNYLACRLPPDLGERLFAVTRQLRIAPVAKIHMDETASVLIRLCELSLDFYFLQTVERLHLGSFGRTTARLGIKTAQGGMSMIINRLAHHLSSPQLTILADVIEGFVLQTDVAATRPVQV